MEQPSIFAAPALGPDLSDIKGQESAKRGAEVALAGGHSLLLIGPAGCGKTMLATRMHDMLPPPDVCATRARPLAIVSPLDQVTRSNLSEMEHGILILDRYGGTDWWLLDAAECRSAGRAAGGPPVHGGC